MSGSKHIQLICIIAVLCTLILTLLFMNGQSIGIAVMTDGDSADGQFTANDRLTDWADSDVTQIRLTGDGADIDGSGAYANGGSVYIRYAGKYIVSGSLTDGSLIVDADGDDKIWIRLDGVDIHSEDTAAILVEQAEKVFLTLPESSYNTISSGSEFSQEAVSSGIDGAVYSRDDLTINGSGSLEVTSGYRHAVVCNDDLVITGGTISLEAVQDGIHANDSARIADADITITAGDDGITVSNDENTGYIYMESGSVSIPSCYEGMEAYNVTIAGGTVDIAPTDDGINANGYGSDAFISITGGDIRIVNPAGRDADGLDSNGSIDISGGTIFISVSGTGGNCALDCGTESGGVCRISGGTLIAAGGSAMAEGFDSTSEQCFIMHTPEAAVSDGTAVTLTNEAGDTLISDTLPCGFSLLILSTPDLNLGDTCTLTIGDTETELTVDNSSVSAAFGGGRMKGMGGPGRGGFPQERPAAENPDAGNSDAGNSGAQRFDRGAFPEERPAAENPDAGDSGTQDSGAQRFDRGAFPEERPAAWNPDAGDPGAQRFDRGTFPDERPAAENPDAGDPGAQRFDRGGRGQWQGRREAFDDAQTADTFTVTPMALALTGISALLLLVGLFAAFRQKSLW